MNTLPPTHDHKLSPDLPSGDAMPVIRKKRSLLERMKNNLPQKMIALLCALIVSVVVLSARKTTMDFEHIPVKFSIPEGFAAINDSGETTVNVAVAGKAAALKHITRDDIGTLNVSPPPRSGNIQITLQPSMISLPDGVSIDKFQPEFLDITLEPIETRTVAVTTDHAFTGELLTGFRLGEVRFEPDEIKISGPKSIVTQISQLYIEPIDLTGKIAPFTINRWVILNRPGLSADSESVRVTVNIVSQSMQHVIVGVPVVPLNLPQNYELKPALVDLTLLGADAQLAKVDNANLYILFDAAQDAGKPAHARIIDPRELSVPNLPTGVSVDSAKLPNILLTVHNPTEDSAHQTQTP